MKDSIYTCTMYSVHSCKGMCIGVFVFCICICSKCCAVYHVLFFAFALLWILSTFVPYFIEGWRYLHSKYSYLQYKIGMYSVLMYLNPFSIHPRVCIYKNVVPAVCKYHQYQYQISSILNTDSPFKSNDVMHIISYQRKCYTYYYYYY